MVLEVVGPGSARTDHYVKVREYVAIPSVRRYAIIHSTGIGVLVLEREEPDAAGLATALSADDILRIPEVGVEIPVADLYEGVTFPEDEGT